MKTISIYEFSELSPEAKAVAIEEAREEMESNEWHEAFHWAVDDCALFEPKHEEMVKVCGEDYYEQNRTPDGKYGQFVFKNRRKIKTFDPDTASNIILGEALEITNDRMLKLWLGIPEIFHESVEYRIVASVDDDFISRGRTTIFFEHTELNGEIMGEVLEGILELAKEKFGSHITDIHSRILAGIDSYFDDENVGDRIEEREYEFLEDGSIWKS